MQESIIRNLTRIFTIASLIALVSAACAAEFPKPEEFTIRYILFTAGPVQYGATNPDNQFILPFEGTGLVLDQDPVRFLQKIKKVWPAYNYKVISSGSIDCANNVPCQLSNFSKPNDPWKFNSNIKFKPRINASDRSITVNTEANYSYVNGSITMPDDPSVKIPVTAEQQLTTTRRLNFGRTYPLSGVETNARAFSDDPNANTVLVFAICVLPHKK
ncbi:MAG: hypothetical protein ACYC27_20980 [Armatimonadota bacterium]